MQWPPLPCTFFYFFQFRSCVKFLNFVSSRISDFTNEKLNLILEIVHRFDIPVAASIDTAMMGMLPAAIVSSFVHWRHQHCGPVLSLCALIGVSATAGSVAANRFDIVPAESEIIPRGGVGLLIFLNGVWFMFKKL